MFPNHSRKPNRLKGYDYSEDGFYFVTVCPKNRIECFGKIKNERMEYSRYGDIVLKYWQKIPDYYQNVFLDEWVIMPNHIHGIIVIENLVGAEQCSAPTVEIIGTCGVKQCSAHTNTVAAGKNQKYGLLSKIVKSFKEISLKTIRKNFNDYEFAWQRSFYDHIIRNERELNKIRQYIIDNPLKWELDRNNSGNLLM